MKPQTAAPVDLALLPRPLRDARGRPRRQCQLPRLQPGSLRCTQCNGCNLSEPSGVCRTLPPSPSCPRRRVKMPCLQALHGLDSTCCDGESRGRTHAREHPPSTGLSRVPHRCALAWPSEPFTSHSGPWHQCAALSRGSLCSCDAVLSLTEARPKPPSWRSPFQRQLVPPHVSVLPTEAAPWTGPALWCLCSACTSCCPPLNLLTLTFYSPFRGWLTPCLSHEDFPGVVCTSTTGLYMSLYTRPWMFEKNTDKAPRSPQICTSC